MRYLKVLTVSLLLFPYSLYSLVAPNYEIDKIYNEKIFYNVFSLNNKVYVSSNDGIYNIKSGNFLEMYDSNVKGPIDNSFAKTKLEIRRLESPILLNSTYNNSTTDFLYFKEYLYIISKGHLLIYKSNFYSFKASGSVRSITENFIGTYSGVFFKERKLESITYTDGQIKEFDSISFVCFNGLLFYKNGIESMIYKNSNRLNSTNQIGNISNIFLLYHPNYLLIFSTGIFKYNFSANEFKQIYFSKKSVIPVRKNFRNGYEYENDFLFVDGQNLKSLSTQNYQTDIVYQFEKKVEDLVAIDNMLYVLTDQSTIITLHNDIEKVKMINEFELSSNYHTVETFNNYLIISGNNDLAIYDINEDNFFSNIIIDEFNKGAIYKDDESISIGSIHGVYNFSSPDKFIMFLNHNKMIKNVRVSEINLNIILVFFITFMLLIIFLFNKKNLVKINNQDMISDIKLFVNQNLNTVTVNSIQSKFGLENSAIYHLNNEFKAGKYIKNRREQKASEMINLKISLNEISKKTGYSLSYLKKNKIKLKNMNFEEI